MTVPASIGRYKITGELGRGAMGVVFRALDPALDRQVAVKVISSRAGAPPIPSDELEARFLREARVAARISHPNVVTVYDAGREGDALYLVMELVEGEPLSGRLSRREFLGPAPALELVAQAADALAAAHALGVVHRDIKPGNIMVTGSGRAKVADFGVAKAIGEETDLTRTGTVVGSPAYMAPEQVRGEALDGRADLFSLGVVLYELLLRRKPFPAETVTTLIYQILHEDPLADPGISRAVGDDVAAFLRKCLAKEPGNRVPDAAAFAAEARVLAARLTALEFSTTSPTAKIAGAQTSPERATSGSEVPSASTAGGRKFPLEATLIASGVALLGIAILIALPRRVQRPPVRPDPPPAATPLTVARVAPATSAPVRPPPRRAARIASTPAVAAAVVAPAPVAPSRPPVVAIFYCRRGADFNVSPEDAIVTVDGTPIGKADDWDNKGGGKTFVFAQAGPHYVKLTLPGYRTTWVEIVVKPGANDEIADVDTNLPKE